MEIREIHFLATAGGFGLRSTPDDLAVNCDCPSCQCAASRRDCRNTQISGFLSPVLFLQRGALRDRHERWERDAMDAACHETNDVIADGEIVWSWRPDAGAKFAA